MNLRVGAASLNQIPMDWERNKKNIREAIREAKKNNLSVLTLPELCLTGYGCEDWFLSESFCQKAMQELQTLLPETENLFVNVGLPVFFKGALYNAIAVISDCDLLGLVFKKYLAFRGVYYENRWFTPWKENTSDFLELAGKKIPVGDLIFEKNGTKIGFEICEEAWVKERTVYSLAKKGVTLVLNPSASHFSFHKQKLRRALIEEACQKLNLHYVYCNLLGNESGRLIFDGSLLIGSPGQVIKESPRFSFRPVELLFQDLAAPVATSARDLSKEEEFSYAVALGLFDYLNKSKAQGFVVSLSGGADSSAVATLVYYMYQIAEKKLGPEFFGKSFSEMLTCLYQGTENNSSQSLLSAQQLSKELGFTFWEWRLDKVLSNFLEFLSTVSKEPITWETQDIALQNIQSRLRVPAPWFLANLKKSLLLVTSNRSEISLGYSTMDGDTSGSLAPIAGVDKAFLLQWLSWAETKGISEVGPVPALKAVNQLKPSPELKPLSAAQTTENELMPFSILVEIERQFILEKKSPLDIWEKMRKEFPQENRMALWVCRFFELFSKNQWKRERLAPSFHLDDENLDPRSFFRFPILNSGFEQELEELRSKV